MGLTWQLLVDLGATADGCVLVRQYWMLYREPGFLAVAWFGSSSTPFPSTFRQKARPATHKKTGKEIEKTFWRERGRGRGRSQIKGPQESLVLYILFSSTLWYLSTNSPSSSLVVHHSEQKFLNKMTKQSRKMYKYSFSFCSSNSKFTFGNMKLYKSVINRS